MKQDLDRLMEERGLDGMVVTGKLNGNPPLFYMINGAKVINGYVFKKRGQDTVTMSFPIDREVAASSGLRVVTTNDYDYEGILDVIYIDPDGKIQDLTTFPKELAIRL